jgi:hypothetical protein
VNEYVEECRTEWKRLGVPDPVADEMAAELAADLEEAEAEGASADEVLGVGALDPTAFATAWATERGVIQWPSPNGHGLRGSRMPAAILALALIAVVGAVLVIVISASPGRQTFPLPPAPRDLDVVISPDGQTIAEGALWVTRYGATTTILGVDRGDSEDNTRTVGSVVLIAGLVGIVLLSLWEWFGRGRSARHRTNFDDPPSGSAY